MSATLAKAILGNRQTYREFCYFMEQRKRADLAMKSFLRMALGWQKKLPKAERTVIADRAAELVAIGEKIIKAGEKALQRQMDGKKPLTPKPIEGADDPVFLRYRSLIVATITSRRPFDDHEEDAKAAMDSFGRSLPVYPWWKENVFDGSAVSLAAILGEAGDLSGYATHSKLWKRMCLAVIDGVRQGGLLKTSSKAAWIAHGYSRQRRSRMWNIGDALIKAGGKYKEIYDARKIVERERAIALGLIVCPAAKIPKSKDGKIKADIAHKYRSDGHIHRRAQRYMEKRLLRDLWKAWRRAILEMPERATRPLPAATEHRDAA